MRVRAAAVLILAAGALAACGGDDSPAPGAAPTSAGATTQAAATGAGVRLDQAQTKAALLAVTDLPTGWSATKYDDSESDSEMKFEPAACQTLFDSLDDEPDTTLHEAGATFTQGGQLATELTNEVATHSDLFEKDKVAGQFSQILSTCGSMTTDVEGQQAQVKLQELAVPQLGDYSKGLRMEIAVGGMTMTADLVLVAAGHNSLSFETVGLGPIDPKDLDAIVRKGFANLEKAGSLAPASAPAA